MNIGLRQECLIKRNIQFALGGVISMFEIEFRDSASNLKYPPQPLSSLSRHDSN